MIMSLCNFADILEKEREYDVGRYVCMKSRVRAWLIV